ncbi:GDSL esterase/lipase 7 [Macadamia integrifolia]|uniref:GDSL esterase/lipase 7 n=1 Tax=Macadamia integrifolia TaxID=60698 RepID=UPI001C4F41BA|nr:GDSL esterase/lipase 7 [Macadamia integrifolia]
MNQMMDIRRSTVPQRFLLCVLFLLLSGIVLVLGNQSSDSSPLTPAMFILGDSLIDNGNNNYIPTIAKANYFPYGIDIGFPTGRFCNGLTVVDYGARFLGLPLIPPYWCPTSKGANILRGVNYASAAAGILDETGEHYGARTPFSGQILLVEKTVRLQLPPFFQTPEALSQFLAKSIFVINIGSNDYINNYLLPNIYTSSRIYNGEAFADLLIRNLSQQLKNLYSLGARKMVLVGIGLLGCIPSQLSMANSSDGCVKPVNNLVTLFNVRLVQLMNTLNATLPGSFFVYQNIYDTFMDMINNPSNYGFSIPNEACCGNGRYGGVVSCLPLQKPCQNRDQYIFWDSFHTTQAVNEIIATRCYTKSSTDCYPISIYQLAQI